MSALFTPVSIKKIAVSSFCGVVVFLFSWVYLNSYYTLSVEDSLFNYEMFLKNKVFNNQPQINRQFVFISTGKDLTLVNDTAGTGNVAISDRYKLFKLLQAINQSTAKPKFILFDLQFYYPYTSTVDNKLDSIIKKNNLPGVIPDKTIDDSLQAEIKRNDKTAISVLLNNGAVDTPLYKASYGIAEYRTYGTALNKFRLNYDDLGAMSAPVLLHTKIDGAMYKGGRYATFCNNKLVFNYIWPNCYYDLNGITNNTACQLYHIGNLQSLSSSAAALKAVFDDKIVLIGNFEEDVHDTAYGKIPGTIILANIYLNLLNGNHYVTLWWVIFLITSFSVLSYVSIYNKLPDIKSRLSFGVTSHIISFLGDYISYITVLALLSLISVLIFNINVSLFIPAFIFSGIDFISQQKQPKQL